MSEKSKKPALTLLAITTAVLGASAPAHGWDGDWLNWRGPNQTGASESAQLPAKWDTKTNVKWKVPIVGQGSSSPIVSGDVIYLTTAIDTGEVGAAASEPEPEPPTNGRRRRRGPAPVTNFYEFNVIALNRLTGKEIWRTPVHKAVPHEPGHNTNTFASGSPVTNGKHIFASFGSDGIYCLDLNGKVLWEKQLGSMITRNQFGEGASPALHGDTLVIPWDHDGYTDANGNGVRDPGELDSAVYALDTTTGEIKWKTPRPYEPSGWATPLITQYNGKSQVIMNGTIVRSYDLETGKQIWECGGQVSNPIPSPVRYQDSVICMSGFRGNAIYAIPLSSKGDVTQSESILWKRSDAAPYVLSPTLYQGVLYYCKSRDGIVHATNAKTGEVVLPQTRLSELNDLYASAVAADGKVFFTSREGVTVVIKAGSSFEKLAVNHLEDGVDATPVISGNTLLIRTKGSLYCIGQ